ncbi:FadR/GntR family transcriptional regulator [Streptomyces sp. NPDC059373]
MVGVTDGVRFQPVEPVRAYERVVDQIEEAVLSGRLGPGQRLPSERDLMAQLSVGRSTVREALRVLESNGLVRSKPGDPRGPEVLSPSPEHLRKTMTRLTRTDALTIGELLQFRMAVEGSTNLVVAHSHTPQDLAAISAALDRMRAAVEEGAEAFSAADMAFHAAVAAAAGNGLFQICGDVVRRVSAALIADTITHTADTGARIAQMRLSVEKDTLVFEAIRRGDGRLAAHLTRRHLFDAYAGYLADDERAVLRELVGDAPPPA